MKKKKNTKKTCSIGYHLVLFVQLCSLAFVSSILLYYDLVWHHNLWIRFVCLAKALVQENESNNRIRNKRKALQLYFIIVIIDNECRISERPSQRNLLLFIVNWILYINKYYTVDEYRLVLIALFCFNLFTIEH